MYAKILCLGLISIVFSCYAHAQNVNDSRYTEYSISADAEKKGPYTARGGRTYFIQYKNPKNGDVIAKEYFDNETRKKIKLILLKNGKKHGIQKEWYKNGSPKSESPYMHGVMHGLFKHWDLKGNLVGLYSMLNGNGVKRIYFSNGVLKEKIYIRNNMLNGRNIILYANGQIESLNWYKNNVLSNSSFAFHENGELYCYGQSDKNGQLNGPIVYFDKKGQAVEKELVYYIHGKKVAQDEYIKATEQDLTLPKLEEDVEKYKEYAYEKTKDIVEKYKNMKSVKIPLEEPTSNE